MLVPDGFTSSDAKDLLRCFVCSEHSLVLVQISLMNSEVSEESYHCGSKLFFVLQKKRSINARIFQTYREAKKIK